MNPAFSGILFFVPEQIDMLLVHEDLQEFEPGDAYNACNEGQ